MTAQIEVVLSGGDRDGDVRLYEPLDEIAGTVYVSTDAPLIARHIWVRLIWFSEGRADVDTDKIGEIDALDGEREIRPGETVRSDFRFQAPDSPWSFAGTYVSIVWAIEVSVDVPRTRDIMHRERIVVRPAAAR